MWKDSPFLATHVRSVERFAVSSNKYDECGKIRRFLHSLLNDVYNQKHTKFDIAINNNPSPDADFESAGKNCKCNSKRPNYTCPLPKIPSGGNLLDTNSSYCLSGAIFFLWCNSMSCIPITSLKLNQAATHTARETFRCFLLKERWRESSTLDPLFSLAANANMVGAYQNWAPIVFS